VEGIDFQVGNPGAAPGVNLREAGITVTRSRSNLRDLRVGKFFLIQERSDFVVQRFPDSLPPYHKLADVGFPLNMVPNGWEYVPPINSTLSSARYFFSRSATSGNFSAINS